MVDKLPDPISTGGALPIALRAVSKNFGSTRVLSHLDLHVKAGQFVAIVGHSGSGKSTLLRLIAGLETPSTGSIRLGDGGSYTRRADLRIMFQEPRLLPWAKVAANVEVGLASRTDRREARHTALQTLRAVGLESRADAWPSVLSGGQKQRVALARALVSRPRFLVLDEPLGALDALTRIEMQRLIERVWLERGFTAVLVTHDVAEALTLADRVVMLEDGAISLDIAVPLPRPRRRGSVDLALLEEHILSRLLKAGRDEPEYVI
jgi:sulfonate transport system ATP-binding protein